MDILKGTSGTEPADQLTLGWWLGAIILDDKIGTNGILGPSVQKEEEAGGWVRARESVTDGAGLQ